MKKTLALVALLGFSGLAAADLINNGSFESVNQNSGTWSIYNNLAGWNVGSNGVEIRNNNAGSAYDGKNFVELDTTNNSSISQSFSAVAGYTYELSFAYSARNFLSGSSNPAESNSNKIGVTVSQGNNSYLNGVVAGSNDTNGNQWLSMSYTFKALSSGTATLMFAALGNSDSYGGSLDAVSLTVSAVPEPETYAMFLAGLGLMVGVARRRKQVA